MNIMINQLGYRPGTIKKAVFSGSSDADSFNVINQDTKECVYSGALSEEKYYEDADENVKIADFTDFNIVGKYYIEDSIGNKSFTFDIKENIYDEALISSVKMFYLQRCGCELDKVSADIFSHKACHNTKARIYGTDEFIDVTGGWHDAGDYGRYVVAATKAILDLLMTYELNQNAVEKYIPQLLDEVKYELDWMLKMQDEKTGGVYHKVTCAGFPGFIMPEFETEELIVSPISDTATYDFVASMAHAYRVYSKIDKYKGDADKYIEAAKKALAYTENNTAGLFKNPEGIVTGEYDDYSSLDEKFLAYAEMYKTTGNKEYEDILMSINLDDVPGLFEWKDVGEYGFYAYITAKEHSNKEFYDAVYKRLNDHAKSIIESVDEDPYGYSMSGKYYWGCNMGVANDAMLLILMDRIDGTNTREKYVSRITDYLFGNNPNGMCYLTGFGSKSPMGPHHRPSVAMKKPMPGMLVGGPEPLLLDDYMKKNFDGVAKAKCYADYFDSYSTNEITIYWNSPLVFVLAEQV